MDFIEAAFEEEPGYDEFHIKMKKSCLDERILVINEDVNEGFLEDYILYILQWNREDKPILPEKRKPIKLYIASNGGDAFAGKNFIDVVLQSRTPVIGVGFSIVASAAYDIYLACSERICFYNTVFLQHDGDLSISNSSKKAYNAIHFLEKMDERTKKFIISRTNMESEFYDLVYDQDFWMHSDKAKELGVVHKIIGVDCDLEYII